jgi:hypothetical protein
MRTASARTGTACRCGSCETNARHSPSRVSSMPSCWLLLPSPESGKRAPWTKRVRTGLFRWWLFAPSWAATVAKVYTGLRFAPVPTARPRG